MTTYAIEARLNVFALPCFIAHCMDRGWVGFMRQARQAREGEHLCPCGNVAYRRLPDKSWTCRECEEKDAVAVELLYQATQSNQWYEDDASFDNPD